MKRNSFNSFIGLFVFASAILASCGTGNQKKAEVIARLEAGEIPEEASRAVIDSQASKVEWLGTRITGSGHNGIISIKEGEMVVFDGRLWGGNVVIDMTSIVVSDIADPDMNARLKGHLESDDFFSVTSFPEANFQIVKLEPIEGAVAGEPNYRVSGNLTIKGITHSLSFPATISYVPGQVTAMADFDFDRSLYDVRFGSGRFFENLGDNLINDNINLKLHLVAAY